MLVEQLKGGSLGDHTGSLRVFLPDEVKAVMKGILSGLACMHAQRIMHRDIKPDNIMFRNLGVEETVLADFGLATECDIPEYLFSRCGTPGYVAPEVINLVDLKSKYSPVCDIYSAGCIFFELLTGKRLFDARNQNDLLRLNKAAFVDFKMSVFMEMEPAALDVLKRMLEKDPDGRAQAAELLGMDYFKFISLPASTKKGFLPKEHSSDSDASFKEPVIVRRG